MDDTFEVAPAMPVNKQIRASLERSAHCCRFPVMRIKFIFILRLLLFIAIIDFVIVETASASLQSDANSDDTKVSSPLHQLLGIDPETGQFVPPEKRDAAANQNDAVGQSSDPESKAGNDATGEPLLEGDQQTDQAFNELAKQLQQINSGESDVLTPLSSIFGEQFDRDRLVELHQLMAWITGGLLLIYPIGRFVAALTSFFWQYRASHLIDSDRRYLKSQLWLRIAFSFVVAGLIFVITLGSVYISWWTDPFKLTMLLAATALLSVLTAVLSALIKELNRGRSLVMLREVREDQMLLRRELEELRKRLQRVTISG